MRHRWLARVPVLRLFRRLRISTLLIGINVGLLLVAIAGVAAVAIGLLQGFADAQAFERVLHAGVIARQEVYRTRDTMRTTAQLLAERPTLNRLLAADDSAGLVPFLQQFQQTGQLDGTAIVVGEQVVVHSGLDVPPQLIQQSEQSTFLGRGSQSDWLVLGASAPLRATPSHRALVLRLLDRSFAAQLSEDIGLSVMIVPRNAARADGPTDAQRVQVLVTGRQAVRRNNERHRYVADLPLNDASGQAVGLIEIEMPTDAVAQSLRRLVESLLVLAITVAAIAALVSFFLGQKLGRPLYALTRAAARIGSGDLATPIPRVTGAEMGTLATTLEEMRTQLLELTDDLRRQQAEAQAIVQGINEGVFTVDRQRRIQFLNPQAAALLGITVDEAIGRFCGDVLRPQGPGGIRPCAEHCPIVHARFRGSARATEHLLMANGERRTVVITSAPTADDRQVQVLRDETEVEATRRLRDSILANISHEFRTPLSAQLASIELLLDQLDELDVADVGRLVVSLQRGTLRLTQLIDNLLESARIESGQYRIRQTTVALDEVVEEALALTQPLLDQREQHVIVDLPFPLPPVRGDTRRLTQVMVNLLANANKYAPTASTITIGGDVGDTMTSVWVEDQGPGLPTNGGPSLFTRFVRSEVDEPEQSGVGLGLWLVKSIVERHGGQIEAHSTQQGTRMRVILPIEQVNESTRR